MHGFTNLAILALAASSLAFQVKFQRFSDKICSKQEKHIQKDTHLDGGKCKTFSKDEPEFESFKAKIEKMPKGNEVCWAQVYSEPDCEGEFWRNWGESALFIHSIWLRLLTSEQTCWSRRASATSTRCPAATNTTSMASPAGPSASSARTPCRPCRPTPFTMITNLAQ
jgi:hypothetical protein